VEANNISSEMWEAAIRDAAGPLSSYIAPEDYGLSITNLTAGGAGHDQFQSEIRKRIDFGRAVRTVDLLEQWDYEPSQALEHRVFYSQGNIAGKIHVSRYLAMRSRATAIGIPVIRAAKQSRTPENLLVSEVLARTHGVLTSWASVGGAEGRSARSLLERANRIEAREPWKSLRSKSRPPFRDLIGTVRSRIVAHVLQSEPLNTLIELVGSESATNSIEAAAGPIAFYATRDARFEDRLFELLCLGWLHGAVVASSMIKELRVWPNRLKANNGEPVLEAMTGENKSLRVYYQSGKPFQDRHWTYTRVLPMTENQNRVGKKFRAIFDFVVEIDANGLLTKIILDAKNRERDQTEVIYKMLGYKENVHVPPDAFIAAAIFPGGRVQRLPHITQIERMDNRVYLLRLPLTSGRRSFRHLLRVVLSPAKLSRKGA
jgi:hypothetical protein